MKKREVDNKPRKGDVLYIHEELMKELNEGLQPKVEAINRAWKVIRTAFPKTILNESFIWSLMCSREVRDYIHERTLDNKAKEMGLDCAYRRQMDKSQGALVPLSQQQKDNRRIFDILTRKDLKPLTLLLNSISSNRNLETYLRIGAISFDYDGNFAMASPDAPSLIRDYCSVSIISNAEAEFVEAFIEAQQAATVLASAFHAIADKTKSKAAQDLIRGWSDKEIQELFVQHEYSSQKGVYLFAENSVWRGMLSHVEEAKQNEAPKFFNRVGYPRVDIEYFFRATGYLPSPTPALRYEYPELYKDVPFTHRKLFSAYYDIDNEGMLEECRKDHQNKPRPNNNETTSIWR